MDIDLACSQFVIDYHNNYCSVIIIIEKVSYNLNYLVCLWLTVKMIIIISSNVYYMLSLICNKTS